MKFSFELIFSLISIVDILKSWNYRDKVRYCGFEGFSMLSSDVNLIILP